MDDALLTSYLTRMGATRPVAADGPALRALQVSHLRTVPFENLAIHLGEDIELTGPALADKVVRRRRGGFCYELNGAFAALLSALGFTVSLLNARVFQDGVLGPPYDHLALLVRGTDGTGPWLADVGFGDHAHHPLLFRSRAEQTDPAGTFRLVDAPDGDLDLLRDGEPGLRLERRPRTLADFEATCWYHRTSPASHFTRSLVCSRLTARGRITLSGRKLTVTEDGRRDVTELPGEAAVLDAYRRHFGIELSREPAVARPAPPAR
jgi:N-hydroxyarylamine O-acetyltransferase